MHILIIEDDQKQCEILKFHLEKEGFLTDICIDGEDAEFYYSQNAYDLILLDRMLPNVDGLTILKKIRSTGSSVPIIMITALGELNDRITGLDYGADDYIVKPYEFQELMAHIRCRLRRSSPFESLDVISYEDVTYKSEENTLTGPKGCTTLSSKEGQLLSLFLRNPEITLQRNIILSRIWGTEYEIETGNLDNYIFFIRRRLKNSGSRLILKNIRGVGFRLTKEV